MVDCGYIISAVHTLGVYILIWRCLPHCISLLLTRGVWGLQDVQEGEGREAGRRGVRGEGGEREGKSDLTLSKPRAHIYA